MRLDCAKTKTWVVCLRVIRINPPWLCRLSGQILSNIERQTKKMYLGWVPSPQCECANGSRIVPHDKKGGERLLASNVLCNVMNFGATVWWMWGRRPLTCLYVAVHAGFWKHGRCLSTEATMTGERHDFRINAAKHVFCQLWFQSCFCCRAPWWLVPADTRDASKSIVRYLKRLHEKNSAYLALCLQLLG